MVSIEGRVELIDGNFSLRIPLSDGGEELAPAARGIGQIEGDHLCVSIPPWLAATLRVAAGSIVVVSNAHGKFTITRSSANDSPQQKPGSAGKRPQFEGDAEKRERGRVLRFNNAKGTGRILSDEFNDEVWVHFSAIVMDGFRTIAEGQSVEYTRVFQPGPHGVRPVAQFVVPVS